MNFSDLDMLWLIWTLPILLLVCFWGNRRRARILTRYASRRSLAVIAPEASQTRRWIKAGLLLAVFALLVLCLAGPRYGFRWRQIERRGVDILVAIDCSKSMMATDIQPTRLDRAKREVVDLLNLLHGDRVGLVAFGGTAFLQCPLTLDYQGFHIFLGALSPGFLPVGGTDLAGAVHTALSGFNPQDATDKAIILITDGESTGVGDPMAAARAAKDADVRLFCIGVGAGEGVPIPAAETGGYIKDGDGNIVLTRLDEPLLKKMAILTGGSYVRSVAGGMDLETIYTRHIRKEMSATTLSQEKQKIHEERFQWFLGLAVLILALELLLPPGKKQGLAAIGFLMLMTAQIAHAADSREQVRLGTAAYESEDYVKALSHFINAQLEAPDSAEISYDIGNAQYRAGDFKAALNSYRQVLASKNTALRHKAHYNLGNTHFRMGKFQEALDSYAEALKLDPSDRQAAENRAFVKRVMQQPKPPPEKNQPDETSAKDQKDPEDPKDPKDQKGDGQDKNPSERRQQAGGAENRSSAKNGHSDAETKRPDAGSKENPADKPSSAPSAQAAPGESDKADETTKAQAGQMDDPARQQAEKMLNRLEDKPGGALIPAYQQRHIEKDW